MHGYIYMYTRMHTPTQGFIVPRIDTVFTLDHPFMASWLKFQIKDGIISPSGRICWHLSLFGCPLEHSTQGKVAFHTLHNYRHCLCTVLTYISLNWISCQLRPYLTVRTFNCPHPSHPHTVITQQLETTASHPTSTITTPSTTVGTLQPTSSQLHTHSPYTKSIRYHATDIHTVRPSITITAPTPRTVVVKDYQILVIVLPTAVCIVLIVLCIMAVGICICFHNHGGRGWK